MRHCFEIGAAEHGLWLSCGRGGYRLLLDEAEVPVALVDGRLEVDGVAAPFHVAHDGDRLFIHIDGEAHEVLYRDPVSRHAADAGIGSHDVLRAPMPGAVVALPVKEGQEVKKGEILLVIESMKLETAIRAPRDGIVESLHMPLSKGFERDAPLVSLAPLDMPS